jgi:hypothetical protein
VRAHAAVLRGARRPRRFKRELVRLMRVGGRDPFRFPRTCGIYYRLSREFNPELRELATGLQARRDQLAAIEALYGEWEVHVESSH